MAKVLIEEKQINSILKAIKIHVSLIESGKVYTADEYIKEKLVESIRYLKTIPDILKGNKDMQKMKRQAYYNYIQSRKDLEIAHMANDKKAIEECKKKSEEYLNYYIKLKEIYALMKEENR